MQCVQCITGTKTSALSRHMSLSFICDLMLPVEKRSKIFFLINRQKTIIVNTGMRLYFHLKSILGTI